MSKHTISGFAIFLLLTSQVHTEEITCNAIEKAAGKIYSRIVNLKVRSNFLLSDESRKAFWDVHEIAPQCPALKKMADELSAKNLGSTAKLSELEKALGVKMQFNNICLQSNNCDWYGTGGGWTGAGKISQSYLITIPSGSKGVEIQGLPQRLQQR